MYHTGVVIDLVLSDGLGDLLPVPSRPGHYLRGHLRDKFL